MSGRRYFVAILLLLSWTPSLATAEPEASDAGVTSVFVHYYNAVAKERWSEAFKLLHERLKTAIKVGSPEELAERHSREQRQLMEAFQTFDRIEVARTEMDLSSIKGSVKGSGGGNVAAQVTYDLLVFLKGPGHPRMYRVVTDVGLSDGRIIRITQQSMDRIDPGGVGDAV
jgi:hypothetical protein